MKRIFALFLTLFFIVGIGVSCKREIPKSDSGRKEFSKSEWKRIQRENQKYYQKQRERRSTN